MRRAVQFIAGLALLAAGANLTLAHIRESWTPSAGGGVAWNLAAQTPASYFSGGRVVYRIVTAGPNAVTNLNYQYAIMNSYQTWEDVPTASIKFVRGADLTASPYSTGLSQGMTDAAGNTQWGGNIGGAAGLTVYSFGAGNFLTDADVCYATSVSFSVDGSGANPIEGTALHEGGHSIGLDHSPHVLSPMSYIGQRDMHTPTTYPYVGERRASSDDRLCVSSIYPEPGWAATQGSLTGTITVGGSNVHKAVVGAFDSNGLLVATTLSRLGTYRFTQLPPGTYTLREFPALNAPYTYMGQHSQNLPWTSDGAPTVFRTAAANDLAGVTVTAGVTTTQNLTVPAGAINQLYTNSVWQTSGGGWGIGNMAIRAPRGATVRIGVQGVDDATYDFPQSAAQIGSLDLWGGGTTIAGGPYFPGQANGPPWTNSFSFDVAISAGAPLGVHALSVTHSVLGQRFVIMGFLEVVDAGTLSAAVGAANPGAQTIPAGTTNVTMLQLALSAGALEPARLRSMTLTASGTGNDATAVTQARLYRDVNLNGVYNAGTDVQLGTGLTYAADNGTIAFNGLTETILAGTTQNYLVVYDLAAAAVNGTTFIAQATALSVSGVDSGRWISAGGLPVGGGTKTIGAGGGVPTISLSAATMNFSGIAGGANPANQTFTVTNSGAAGSTLNYSISDGSTWMSEAPTSGALASGASSTITVSINTVGLAAGTYSGTITVTDPAASNNPQTIAVTLTLTAAPTIALAPASLTFSATQGGANPANQTFSVTNSGGAGSTLNFSITDNATWMTEAPTSGALASGASSTITVSINIAGLLANTYSGTITVTDPAATNNPQTVAVTLTIASPGPTIGLAPASLTFSATQGGANPPNQTFTVTNTGVAGSTLNFSITDNAAWMTEAPTSGALAAGASSAIAVSISITGLVANTYTGTITVSDPASTNNPQTVAVTLTILPPAPTIAAVPASLTFTGSVGGPNPPNQTLTITNSGGAGSTLNFSITDNATWMTEAPTSGALAAGASSAITVSINTTGLAVNTYTGTITISDPAATNNPKTVTVTLEIKPLPLSAVTTAGSYGPTTWVGAIQGTGADNSGTGLTNVQVTIQRASDGLYWTGAAWGVSTWLTATGTTSWTYSFAPQDGQSHIIHSRATDNVGGVQTALGGSTFTYDATAPASSISTAGTYSSESYNGAIQGTATDATSGVASTQVTVRRTSDSLYWNGSAWAAAATWLTATGGLPAATGTTSWSYSFAPAGGLTYALQSRATDSVGNVQSPATNGSFTYFAYSPDSAVLTSGPYGVASWPGSVSGSATTGAGAVVTSVDLMIQRQSDGLYWSGSAWVGPATWLAATGATSWSYAFTGVSDGVTYAALSRAHDSNGFVETTYGSATFTFDATPAASAVTTSGTISQSAWPGAIQGTATDGTSGLSVVGVFIQRTSDGLYFDGGAWLPAPTWVGVTGTTNWVFSFNPALGETYKVQSRATDGAGNVETPGAGTSFQVTASASTGGTSTTTPTSGGGKSGGGGKGCGFSLLSAPTADSNVAWLSILLATIAASILRRR